MDYTKIATDESINNVITATSARNITSVVVTTKEEALERIKSLIPANASVMNGASRTLEEVGFIDYLKSGTHGWNNLHEGILAETDPAKQGALRRQALLSDYYLGSAHAVSETGELVIASNTGSQLPHIVYSSLNVIFVVGAQKITPNLAEAFKRLDEQVIPLEDERMKGVYGVGTQKNKTVIFHGEHPMMGRKIHLIIVKEKLGF